MMTHTIELVGEFGERALERGIRWPARISSMASAPARSTVGRKQRSSLHRGDQRRARFDITEQHLMHGHG